MVRGRSPADPPGDRTGVPLQYWRSYHANEKESREEGREKEGWRQEEGRQEEVVSRTSNREAGREAGFFVSETVSASEASDVDGRREPARCQTWQRRTSPHC